MARRWDRDHIPIQGPLSHRAGPSLDIQPPPPLVRHGRSEIILVEEQEPDCNSVKTRQPRPEPPVSQGRAPVIPEPIRERSRFDHDMHDTSLSKRGQTPGPERSPSVRPPERFLSESLYTQRPPAAPAHLGGGDPPPGSTSLYTQHRPEGVVLPPGSIDSQPGQRGAPSQCLRYVPMPPGPVVVQLPLLFDTLMAKLREHRLAQLATVDQQRELMMYMSGWNDWLTRDLQDRQAVITRVNQLREDLGRLGVGAGPDGFAVPPVPPAPGGSVPPVVPYPAVFFPQGGPEPPIIPGMDQSPSAHFPVVPAVPAGCGMPMPDPSQNVGRTGPVLPAGTPHGEYHPTRPSQDVHYIEEPDERVIPLTSSPERGMMIVPPSPSHDSRSSMPDQESYPPHSPGALPAPPGGVPNVIPVDPSVGGPPPHQTIINIPQIGIHSPGHTVQPSLQCMPTAPIVSHPPTLGPSVPATESVYVPSQTSSSASTSYATIPSGRGERDRQLSFSIEDAPDPPCRYPSSGSAIGDDWNSHQRMSSRGAALLPADLDDEQRDHLAHEHLNDLESGPSSPWSRTATYLDSSQSSTSALHQRSHAITTNNHGHLLARLISIEEAVREINAAAKNRERSDQELARLREEFKLYKLQFENVQKEILRARDIIDQVGSQRNEAEAEAASARTMARKLQEEKLVMLAREEGRRMGYQEGVYRGSRMGYNEGSGCLVTGPLDRFPHLSLPRTPQWRRNRV
ncbi:hypothetical protein OG21DRAFT_904057 [Imleria badia]|nr:hypothetical protein OG21DRAFT_904057 [Imleria badia]